MIRFAVVPPNWSDLGDPEFAAELALAAEDAGWDGYFVWDGLVLKDDPPPVYDPFIILSSVASATTRIRIGTCILVPARYPPHLLAMRLASLDILSGGRLIVGVGLGDGGEVFERFGESGDAVVRAEKLDEALEIMTRLWAGERLDHHGSHYTVDGYTLSVSPVQQPRIPIWVGGDSKAALRRAARWDGWIGPDEDPLLGTVDDLKAVRSQLDELTDGRRVDLGWAAETAPTSDSNAAALEEAGATWWMEPMIGSRTEIMRRVESGPPTPE